MDNGNSDERDQAWNTAGFLMKDEPVPDNSCLDPHLELTWITFVTLQQHLRRRPGIRDDLHQLPARDNVREGVQRRAAAGRLQRACALAESLRPRACSASMSLRQAGSFIIQEKPPECSWIHQLLATSSRCPQESTRIIQDPQSQILMTTTWESAPGTDSPPHGQTREASRSPEEGSPEQIAGGRTRKTARSRALHPAPPSMKRG